jgi:hypothetical protein
MPAMVNCPNTAQKNVFGPPDAEMQLWVMLWSQPRAVAMTNSQHVYEVRLRKDKRGVDLISDALPFGRLWYGGPNAVGHANFL